LQGSAGEGSYGRVLVARDCHTGETVVLKTECGVTCTRNEFKVYRTMGPIPGIPRCHAAYLYRDHGVLVLDRLGDSLETLLRASGGALSNEKVYKLGRDVVKILQTVHEKGYVHRDIKPDNIMLPENGSLEPHLIDFGHAKRYRDLDTGKRLLLRGAVGTLPFMSINVQDGVGDYTPRDDLVSLAYTLIYLAHGTLPWLICKDARQCKEQKQGFRLSHLNPPLPISFELFLEHLQRNARPDYSYLIDQLR